ncbi:hypothetical protein [Novosphingobium sp.]|uniref:hypothetical protein n=1 Tax=Novosphingobium sp. TaxID=1874826 RepID=UPI0035B21372
MRTKASRAAIALALCGVASIVLLPAEAKAPPPAARSTLEIRVATKWVNRLIGDAQPGATKVVKLAASGYLRDAPLRPSGLAGPVTLWTTAP